MSGDPAPPCEDRRPPVPRVTDHVATPLRHRRNFIKKNTVDAMISAPQDPEDPHFVDSHMGHSQSLAQSGMMPVFSNQKVIFESES